MNRETYAANYGPTAGDRIRLGDTGLLIEVERDDSIAGEEVVSGFGKTQRDGIFVQATADSCDLAILGVVLVDPVLGVRKTSIGIRNGRISAIGRAGNPHTMDGPIEVVLGTGTAIISGQGLIATAGGIDSHVHLVSPRVLDQALASGITTVIGQDYGPVWNLGANPPWALKRMLMSMEAWPINVALLARGSSSLKEPVLRSVEAGAAGLKIHEDVGAHSTALETALQVADEHDIQVAVHTDGLNECLSVEDTLSLLAGRTIHAFHIEGAGGGHAPDLLRLVGEPNVISSSTNPAIPFGRDALAEHEDMVASVHELRDGLPGDRENARARVRPGTMGVEDQLHDLGMIPITSSDSQGMGRIGETFQRTFQMADRMRDPDLANQNEQALRYLAKVTANPALAHGLSHEVGLLAPGLLADIVLWDPKWFAVRPELVLKSGFPAWGAVGDPNASTPESQPVRVAAQFGATGSAAAELSVAFVSKASLDGGTAPATGHRLSAVGGCRTVTARDMLLHGRLGAVRVDPETNEVTLDGKVLRPDPAESVSLNRLYRL